MPPETRAADPACGVLLLAGGQASRLPGKLELPVDGIPLLVRVYERVRSLGPVIIAANRGFAPEIDAALRCPIVIDRYAKRGPLGGIVSALPHMAATQVFVVAADLPFACAQTATQLRARWTSSIQGVVPSSGGRLHPLCAVYDRLALLQAAAASLARDSGTVKSAVERLAIEAVVFSDDRRFFNVNTPADRRALLESGSHCV